MVCSRRDRMSHRPRILASLTAALVLISLAVVPLAAAKQPPRTLKLRFPRTVIPAGGNVEDCVFIRVPVPEAFDLASYQITQRGFSGTGVVINHFLIYLYAGERLGELPTQQKHVLESRAWLEHA